MLLQSGHCRRALEPADAHTAGDMLSTLALCHAALYTLDSVKQSHQIQVQDKRIVPNHSKHQQLKSEKCLSLESLAAECNLRFTHSVLL